MSGKIDDPREGIRFVAEVHDNWYAIRQESNRRLLSVGVYLPAPAEGIVTERVEQTAVIALLMELDKRSRGPSLVGTIEGCATI